MTTNFAPPKGGPALEPSSYTTGIVLYKTIISMFLFHANANQETDAHPTLAYFLYIECFYIRFSGSDPRFGKKGGPKLRDQAYELVDQKLK